MEDPELLRRYALAISLIPDADAASDIFMESVSEADLYRRAARWRTARQLPPPGPDAPLPPLDAIQREHARDLVRRAALRRQTRLWLAGVMTAVLLLSLLVVGRLVAPTASAAKTRTVQPPASGKAGPNSQTGTRIVPLTVEPHGGRLLPTELDSCRRTALVKSQWGEPLLVVTVPYTTEGEQPAIASAVMHVSPDGAVPSKLFVDVRATPPVGTAPAGCYMLLSEVTLPDQVRGRQVELVVTVRPARVAAGATWSSDPIWAP